MKVGTAVRLILSKLLIRESEAEYEADEVQDTIEMMNLYANSLAAKGVNLGYTNVSDTGDEITVPDGALMGLLANTAIRTAPLFGAPVTQELVAEARDGLNAMLQIGVSMSQTEYPSTLPRGSGNDYEIYDNFHFYQDLEDTILTESGGSIGLESDTDS